MTKSDIGPNKYGDDWADCLACGFRDLFLKNETSKLHFNSEGKCRWVLDPDYGTKLNTPGTKEYEEFRRAYEEDRKRLKEYLEEMKKPRCSCCHCQRY